MINFFKKSEPVATEALSIAQIAEKMVESLGGRANIEHIDACLTRLRIELKNIKIVDKQRLKELGAIDTVKINDTNIHVILGKKTESYLQAVNATLTP